MWVGRLLVCCASYAVIQKVENSQCGASAMLRATYKYDDRSRCEKSPCNNELIIPLRQTNVFLSDFTAKNF